MSVGVRGTVPTSGWVVTQLVTQYAQDVWRSQGGPWRHQLGNPTGSRGTGADLLASAVGSDRG